MVFWNTRIGIGCYLCTAIGGLVAKHATQGLAFVRHGKKEPKDDPRPGCSGSEPEALICSKRISAIRWVPLGMALPISHLRTDSGDPLTWPPEIR